MSRGDNLICYTICRGFVRDHVNVLFRGSVSEIELNSYVICKVYTLRCAPFLSCNLFTFLVNFTTFIYLAVRLEFRFCVLRNVCSSFFFEDYYQKQIFKIIWLCLSWQSCVHIWYHYTFDELLIYVSRTLNLQDNILPKFTKYFKNIKWLYQIHTSPFLVTTR